MKIFLIFLLFGVYLSISAPIPVDEEEIQRDTVVELSVDGTLSEPVKVPYGSHVHIIVSEGHVDVRLNSTSIPFNKLD